MEQLSALPKLTDESSGNEADQSFAEGIVQGVLVGRDALRAAGGHDRLRAGVTKSDSSRA